MQCVLNTNLISALDYFAGILKYVTNSFGLFKHILTETFSMP